MIKTNKHWRPFIYRDDVPESVLESQFDYHDCTDGYFRYRGVWYHFDQFMAEKGEWDGSLADSAFSGVVIKLSPDGQEYQIGTWLSLDGDI